MVHVGTCGFSYEDWRGVFYPEDLVKRDFLRHYSSEFSVLELDTTFYRLPNSSFLERLGEKTPDDFHFFIKAYRGITHEIGDDSQSHLGRFLDALSPLVMIKKLGGILLQFPYSFHKNSKNVKYLEALLASTRGIVSILEFRNRDWFNEEVFHLLREHDAGFCSVDEPRLKGLPPPSAIVTSTIVGYVRLHGRNAAKWWVHQDPSERYDYLYSDEELADWRDKILEMAAKARDIHVMFNNHRGGKAIINARRMKDILRGEH
jgi:uncharacterized protein YecE (DUF72 family)